MRIALISNPTSRRQKPDFPPIGIAYLGAMAHHEGHEILLLDGGLQTISQIIDATRKFSPDVIGVTCWTIGRDMVWKLCAALKKSIPEAFLILGGPHASIYPEHIFKKTQASAVVTGEGDVGGMRVGGGGVDLRDELHFVLEPELVCQRLPPVAPVRGTVHATVVGPRVNQPLPEG